MDLENILNKKVSFQKNVWSLLEEELLVREILQRIKREDLKVQIDELRMLLTIDKGQYDRHKKKLPGVTFCGVFNTNRKGEDLKDYNNIIVIDIDKLTDEQLEKTREALKDDEFVFAFWKSPSGKGFKGLVSVQYNLPIDNENALFCHKEAFQCLVNYFYERYSVELDISGSDITRLCFLSSDSNLVLKTSFSCFSVEINIEKEVENVNKNSSSAEKIKIRVGRKQLLLSPNGKNLSYHRNQINSIIKFLTKRNLSITETYDDWLRVALVIANSFTHDIGEKYFLSLCQLDGLKHNEIESKNLLIYCYENSRGELKFKTLLYLAQQKGYKNKKEKRGGTEEAKISLDP